MKTAVLTLVLSLLVALTTAHADAPSGWKFKAGVKGKPAVLLIHGLAASRTHWTSPADTWSIKSAHFKHWKAPKKQSGHDTIPMIKGGIRSIVTSKVNKRADEEGSFWTYLVKEGYTVATWNQVPCMDTADLPSTACKNKDVFDAAYPTAEQALAHLATLTTEDIALVAHSRGGLIGRKLLKQPAAKLPAIGRVKWLVTLHTPHHGSSMATKGTELEKLLGNPLKRIDLGFVPKALREAALKLVPGVGKRLVAAVDLLVAVTGMAGARELSATGPVLKGLEAGETKRAGVKYYTFGGTSPRVVRVYARVYSDGGQDWKTEPKELLDFPGDLKISFDEMTRGGDLLVTDASATLGFEDTHFKNALNHAEVLWNRGVQRKVASLLVAAPTITDAEITSGDDDTDEDTDDEDEPTPATAPMPAAAPAPGSN